MVARPSFKRKNRLYKKTVLFYYVSYLFCSFSYQCHVHVLYNITKTYTVTNYIKVKKKSIPQLTKVSSITIGPLVFWCYIVWSLTEHWCGQGWAIRSFRLNIVMSCSSFLKELGYYFTDSAVYLLVNLYRYKYIHMYVNDCVNRVWWRLSHCMLFSHDL